MSRRSGFTLIELLVVIAIIAVLIGLLHANVITPTLAQSNDGGTDDPSSFHTGGANHVFGDCSMRFIRSPGGIKGSPPPADRLAYWAMGTRADSDFMGDQ